MFSELINEIKEKKEKKINDLKDEAEELDLTLSELLLYKILEEVKKR